MVLGLTFGLSMLIISAVANAAQWSLAPEIEANGRYEDNPRLSETGDENEIWGGALDLSLTGERKTERSSISFRPRLYMDRYDDSDEDSDDQFLDIYATTQGQRSVFRLNGNLSNEQVRRGEVSTVEFSESELDETDESDSGRIDRRRDRFRWRVRPEYIFDLTRRTKLGTAAQYIDVDYNNEVPGEALDYTDSSVELFISRVLSEKSEIRLTAFGSKYESDEISNDSQSYGGKLTYQNDATETFSWYAEAGAQSTDVEAGDDNQIDDTTTSYVFGAGAERKWERTRLRAEINRSVDPSGTGFLKTRDLIRVNLRRQIRPRLFGELGVVALTEDDVDDTLEVNQRDYARGAAKLSWQLKPEWFLEAGYAYTYQDYNDTPGDADSNEFLLGVVFRPTAKRWSR